MLCSHMILVSTRSTLSLYEIPEFTAVCHDIQFLSNLSTPLASHVLGKPNHGRLIWDTLCPHHDRRIWTYTFSPVEEALLILPLPGQSEDDLIHHVFDGPCYMGSSCAIACKETVKKQPVELQCFAPCTRHERHTGYVRVGRTRAPNPSRPVSIVLPGYDGLVEELSWDEESGQISIV
jgi:hypothetical protein